MPDPLAFDNLARASIPVTRDMAHLGQRRLDVFLRPSGNGRYRWFHADGKPTVVDGGTVDEAVRIARLVWRDLAVVEHHTAAPPDAAL